MGQFSSKPLAWFKVAPQVRKTFDEAELRLLGESLKVKQLQPVVAKPDGTLIAGERRYRAAKLVGLACLDVVISEEPLSESQLRIFQLTENIHRADLTGYEKWRACLELIELNPSWMAKDLAAHLHLDPSMVTRLLSPGKCIQAAQEALASGKLGISDCYALAKVPESEQAGLLAMKLGGASRDAIEQQGRKKRAASEPSVRLSRVRIALPEVSIVVTGDGISLDEVIESLTEAAKEAKKAREQALDVKTWVSVMRDRAIARTPE